MRVVKYQRCSTDHQEIENQTSSIDQHIERMGWDCVGEYKDVNQSGMKSRDSCLLYTSPSPRDRTRSRMPSSA